MYLQCRIPRFRSLDQENLVEKEIATHSSIFHGNSMDRRAWWATVHRVAKSQTTEQLTLSHFVKLSDLPLKKLKVITVFSCADR